MCNFNTPNIDVFPLVYPLLITPNESIILLALANSYQHSCPYSCKQLVRLLTALEVADQCYRIELNRSMILFITQYLSSFEDRVIQGLIIKNYAIQDVTLTSDMLTLLQKKITALKLLSEAYEQTQQITMAWSKRESFLKKAFPANDDRYRTRRDSQD